MWLSLIIISIIYIPYFLVIRGVGRLWINMDIEDPESFSEDIVQFSVVIPFRNEKSNLSQLIKRLNEQLDSWSEVILVDDHSSDGGESEVAAFIQDLPNFKLILNNGEGKKDALTSGIDYSANSWIVTLDADVRISATWGKEILKRIDGQDDMVILPVTLENDRSVLQKFDVFDFLILQGFTFCYARNRKPFLANGAHLAFKKSTWNEVNGYSSHNYLASGDDVFLLESFKKHGKIISWEWSKELTVRTSVNSDFNSFIKQRIRWGSKTSKLDSKELKTLSVLILAANSALLVLFIFLYPFYITFVGIATLVVKPTWKGRKI